jgi:Domain of unknown function (DUF1996)
MRRVISIILLTLVLFGCRTESDLPLDPQVFSGSFTAACPTSHVAYNDPIVYPGLPGLGLAHLHTFFGHTNPPVTTAYTAALQRGQTTCADRPGDTAAYWSPSLLVWRNGTLLGFALPKETRSYYRSNGIPANEIVTIPDYLKVIAGDANATIPQPITVFNWACTVQGLGEEIELTEVPGGTDPAFQCLATSPSLRYEVKFPQCWNGVNLDSADHKSHMTYKVGGGCPATHPVKLPQLTVGHRYWYGDPIYVIPPVNGANTYTPTPTGQVFLRSDTVTLSSGSAYTGHSDFWNGWHIENLQEHVAQCINAGLACGDFGGPTIPKQDQLLWSHNSNRTPSAPLLNAIVTNPIRIWLERHDLTTLMWVKFYRRNNDGTYTLYSQDNVGIRDMGINSSETVSNGVSIPLITTGEAVKVEAYYIDGFLRTFITPFDRQ